MPAALACFVLAGLGCASSRPIEDPAAELATPLQTPSVYLAAIDIVRERPLTDDELQALRGMMYQPGYVPSVREAALDLLAEKNPEALKATIEIRLPQMVGPSAPIQWRERLCEIIAERGWRDLSPTLVRAWAFPMPVYAADEFERPEYLALAELHGEDRVIDAVFDLLVDSNTVALQGLRTSCWTLLQRLGQRDRLVALLENADITQNDAMLLDLRAGATELGVIPVNREEILWIRKLREPERREFWAQAVEAVGRMPASRRNELELRDLSIVVAASHHEPELLGKSRSELYALVDSYIDSQTRHFDYDGAYGLNNETLASRRDELTWGDLAAMLMAVRAMRVPQVVDHLFDYADRDLADESTEYGGVIRLDHRNRFEVLEYPPRIRLNDRRFVASQEMFDAGYGAVFHFHFHCQEHDNSNHAGPGFGDAQYADFTRANCLVMTFVDETTMNIDYYRHGRVVVDLGEIHRP